MKTKISLLVITLFASAILFTSCSKDNDQPISVPIPIQEQNPLPGYLAASGFDQTTIVTTNVLNFEIGFSFMPLVNGKITAIVLKIPEGQTNAIRVTIWDKAQQSIVRTENIVYTTADVEVIKTITPIDLVSGREYVISMNSNDYYIRKRTNGANVTYPFTTGDFKITSYNESGSSTQTFPPPNVNFAYVGDCSFKFQKS